MGSNSTGALELESTAPVLLKGKFTGPLLSPPGASSTTTPLANLTCEKVSVRL